MEEQNQIIRVHFAFMNGSITTLELCPSVVIISDVKELLCGQQEDIHPSWITLVRQGDTESIHGNPTLTMAGITEDNQIVHVFVDVPVPPAWLNEHMKENNTCIINSSGMTKYKLIEFCSYLGKNGNGIIMDTLEIHSGPVFIENFGLFVDALRTNTTLISLGLHGSDEIDEENTYKFHSIDNEKMCVLADVLCTNSSLTSLNLESNHNNNEVAHAFANVLRSNISRIQSLNLANNHIENEGASALANALCTNRTLLSLDLSENNIGSEGASALSYALRVNTSLTSLSLRCTEIKTEGGCAIAESLCVNSTLTSLLLGCTGIDDIGVCALSNALKVNTTLTCLDIGYNFISVQGCLALSDALWTNKSLHTLKLCNTDIDNEGFRALSDAIRVNVTLTTLDVFYTDNKDEIIDAVAVQMLKDAWGNRTGNLY